MPQRPQRNRLCTKKREEMPKTNEIAFNVRLLDVLQTKHPRWRDHVGVEQRDVLREAALQPDIVIRPPGGVPVIIETEFMPARSVEADAKARLGKFLEYNGDLIEQTIAAQVPQELSRAPQKDLGRQIEAAEFRYCTFSLQQKDTVVRWPSEGWITGSIDDLAACIENVSLSERLLAEGTQILEQSIGEAAGKLRETASSQVLERMSQSLHQEDGEQTSRMAMAIVANALVFHTAIVDAHGIPTIDELRILGRNDVSKSRLLACWQHILDNINYYPIFRIASDLLLPIADSTANAVLNRLAQAANARRLLESEYKDLTVLSIAAHGQTDRAFSADTGMAEVLVVANKCHAGQQGCGKTLFVNLYHRPRSLAEAFEVARAVSRLSPQARQGRICVGDQETIGTYIRASLSQGGCASLRETILADAALGLEAGMLRLPQGYSTPLSTIHLGAIGKTGLLHRDISGTTNGAPRGPFEIIPIQGVPQYPVLWSHDAQRERSLVVLPDSEGEVRPGCGTQAVSVWKRTSSRLHFNLDFQINSQSLTACLTPTKAIGGTAWPNFIPSQDKWTLPLVLWANTTLGLLAFWWIGTRQQQGRARLTITQLPRLTVLDPRHLSAGQIAQAEDIFEAFKDAEFLPANEAYRDETRKALDHAVLVNLLRLPEATLEPLSILRDQWCAEPSVHGGKSTRIDV